MCRAWSSAAARFAASGWSRRSHTSWRGDSRCGPASIGERAEPVAVAAAQPVFLRRLGQTLQPVLAHRLQQPVAHGATVRLGKHQRLVDERFELPDRRAADVLGRLERETAHEHSHAPQRAMVAGRSSCRGSSPPRRAACAGVRARYAPRRPASAKRSDSRSANCSTESVRTRAAANSIASGSPSRRRQIAAHGRCLRRREARPRLARALDEQRLGVRPAGQRRDTPVGLSLDAQVARLVASTETPGAAVRTVAAELGACVQRGPRSCRSHRVLLGGWVEVGTVSAAPTATARKSWAFSDQGFVVDRVNVSVLLYAPVRSASLAPIACLKAIVRPHVRHRRGPGVRRDRDLQRLRQAERRRSSACRAR